MEGWNKSYSSFNGAEITVRSFKNMDTPKKAVKEIVSSHKKGSETARNSLKSTFRLGNSGKQVVG